MIGFRNRTPIKSPQKLLDAAPIAVVLTSWFSLMVPPRS
jgi:hypothetical protein